MGTNYYLVDKSQICPHCGHNPNPELHIGKSSAGWHFGLHVYPDMQPKVLGGKSLLTLDDWIKLFDCPNVEIKDEYGAVISKEDMLDCIKNRGRSERPMDIMGDIPRMMARGICEWGLNNLLRSKIDGHHCIGHGEGTWDYEVGDFS